MKSRRVLFLAAATLQFLSLPFCLLSQNAPTAPLHLAEPDHQAQIPMLLQTGFSYWDHGYLISYAQGGTSEVSHDKPGAVLYDRNGQVAREALVWLEGARSVSVGDAAVSPSGQFVVAGGADNEQGVIANFIGEVGADGRLRRVIRTTPFLPVYVCAPGDGSVWSYGIDRDEHLNGIQDSPRLRQFSFEKGQLRALSSLGQDWPLERGSYAGAISLRCNSKSVVLYNAERGSLAEFDLRTASLEITKMAPLPPAAEFKILGFALTDSGQIFASFYDRSRKPAVSGMFRLRRDNAGTAEWVAIEGATGPYLHGSPIERLLGSDGDDLVYTKLRDGRLYWSKQTAE